MTRCFAVAAVLAGAMLAGFSSTSQAFHHRAVFYYPYVVPGACGTIGVTSGCTIIPCGVRVRHHHCLFGHCRYCLRYRYGWCGWGCGCYGGCGYYGGCGAAYGCGCTGGDGCVSGCTDGYSATQDAQSGNEVRSSAEEVSPFANDDQARASRGRIAARRSTFRLISDARSDGADAFERGVTLFRSRSYNEALSAFDAAAAAEPDNALYQYYRALALYDANGGEAAGEALQQAVELEQRSPISDWGKRMERVQGRGRLWVETARRKAGLVR